ncbi:MAG: SDR family oxidoreductase [Acidobacteriia bacterium]|nr:SDR family oxidoreductase [Terriglobia bacterium]
MSGTALITGASSGIGAAFAEALAARGLDLVLVARRKELLERLARGLEQSRGIATEVLEADLTLNQDLALVEQRIAAAANLELLVNNAGFGTRGKFFNVDARSQDQMHRLHVLATMRLTHAALEGMVQRGRGGVINVSSVAAFWQSPGSVSYCATKCWMNSFTEGLALELAGSRSPVSVQALCPGYTRSEFHDTAGMKREAIPSSWWMTAEDVVAASLRGLERGDTFVIPGWRYQAAVFLLKHAPRVLLRRIAVHQMRRMGRD